MPKTAKQKINDLDTAEVTKLRRELEEAKRKQRAAELAAKEAEKMAADYHASNFEMPRQKVRKYQGKGSFVRIAFGDTHGCSLDQKAWNAFLADVETLKPREIIHGGDILDCDGWLASHHTTNYVAQTSYSYADEVVAGNKMLDQLQSTAPNARIDLIEGNHDLRVETWCLTNAQKHAADATFLINQISPRKVLNVDERGLNWFSRGDCHHGSAAGGTIQRGRCWFTHPSTSSKHSACKMVESFADNVVYFHTHRRDYFTKTDIKGGEHAAWCPGCMCVKRKYWHHTNLFGHTQGYHLQLVQSNGEFLGINVPIIDGRSYLSGLVGV